MPCINFIILWLFDRSIYCKMLLIPVVFLFVYFYFMIKGKKSWKVCTFVHVKSMYNFHMFIIIISIIAFWFLVSLFFSFFLVIFKEVKPICTCIFNSHLKYPEVMMKIEMLVLPCFLNCSHIELMIHAINEMHFIWACFKGGLMLPLYRNCRALH